MPARPALAEPRLPADEEHALLEVMVRLARSYAASLEARADAEGVTPEEILRRDALREDE